MFGQPKQQAAVSPEQLNEVLENVAKLGETISAVAKNVETVQNQISQRQAPAEPQQAPQAAVEPQPEKVRALSSLTEEEYENFSPIELERLRELRIEEMLGDKVKAAIEPLVQNLTQLSGAVQQNAGMTEVERMRSAKGTDGQLLHPDFDDWVPEMKTIAEQYPNMNLKDVYDLAKVKNSKKAAEVAAKYAPQKKELPAEFGQGSFGGLSTGMASPGKDQQFTLDDAAQMAAAEVLDQYGGMPAPVNP